MTRGKDIIEIFRQNGSFCHFLVVWGARVRGFGSLWTTSKMAGNLGGLNVIFQFFFPLSLTTTLDKT
jgi:hypothetical protein